MPLDDPTIEIGVVVKKVSELEKLKIQVISKKV
jgi:hypothetical protein